MAGEANCQRTKVEEKKKWGKCQAAFFGHTEFGLKSICVLSIVQFEP